MTSVAVPRPIEPFTPAGVVPIADPYPVYRRYREADPVHRVASAAPGGSDTWYLFGHREVSQVLTRPGFVRRLPGGPPPAPIPQDCPALSRTVSQWLVFLDPPRHTRLRSLVADRFTPAMVADLRPRITRLTAELTEELRQRTAVDLVGDFAAPLPILVIGEMLGLAGVDRQWIRRQAVRLQEANSSRGADPQRFARAESATVDLLDYFHREIAHRRQRSGHDLISLLVHAEDPMSDHEIASNCIHLLTAGHETTTNLIGKAMLALLRRPKVADELRAQPALMPGAVDEFVRYDPPVQLVSRRAREGVTIGGHEIAAGSTIRLVLGSANRDPARFADPDVLDIRRRPGRHSGFGLGIHYCLGAALARTEAEIALGALLRDLASLTPADEPVQWAEDLVFHGPTRIPLQMRNTGIRERK